MHHGIHPRVTASLGTRASWLAQKAPFSAIRVRAKPADVAIERPRRFELGITVNTLRRLA